MVIHFFLLLLCLWKRIIGRTHTYIIDQCLLTHTHTQIRSKLRIKINFIFSCFQPMTFRLVDRMFTHRHRHGRHRILSVNFGLGPYCSHFYPPLYHSPLSTLPKCTLKSFPPVFAVVSALFHSFKPEDVFIYLIFTRRHFQLYKRANRIIMLNFLNFHDRY